MRMINKFLVFLVVSIYLPASVLANITCDLDDVSTTINFGTINPYDAVSNDLTNITIPIVCNQNTTLWDYLQATVYFTPVNASRTMTNGSGGILPYGLYTNAGFSNLIGTSGSGLFNFTDNSMGFLVTTKTFTRILYGKIAANLYTVPAGTYTDTIFVNLWWRWDDNWSSNFGLGGTIPPGPSSVIKAVNVTAVVQNTCTVTGGTMNFGTFDKLAPDNATSSGVTVQCTNGATYSVGLGNGQNYTTGRRMRIPSTSNYLNYGLYADSNYSQNWGNITGGTTGINGTATYGGAGGPSPLQTATATGSPQSITIYGQIPTAGNASAVAGSYTDTVAIVVYSY